MQKRLALRMARAYRTVSGVAPMVLAGVPPAEYMADAQANAYAWVKAIRLQGGTTPGLWRYEGKKLVGGR